MYWNPATGPCERLVAGTVRVQASPPVALVRDNLIHGTECMYEHDHTVCIDRWLGLCVWDRGSIDKSKDGVLIETSRPWS
jgi:hypothetical protein